MTTTPTVKSKWILKHVGNVGVDSGFIRVSDTAGNPPVTTQAPEADGIFPVYQAFEDRRLIGLFLGFELEVPAEGDGRVRLGNMEKGT